MYPNEFPQPVSEHPYNKYLLHIKNVSLKNAEESISSAAKQLRKVIGKLDDDDDSILNVAVSVDGTWQKRYGFNSLLGVIFIISIDTDCVLDFSIKSLICHVCKKNKEATETWEKIHEATCLINHEGSSGSMEKEGEIEMFLRSVEKHKLRYTKYVGDDDTGSFGAVKEAVTEKYGEHYPLQKEDCIGHVQKRMGTALISFKNKKRGSVLSDGKGVGGSGRLTNVIIDKIQTYYGYAIRKNKGNTGKIQEAIWAIYHHMLKGPETESLDEQHTFCPKTDDTWCRYQKDVVMGENSYTQNRCLPYVFREELKPIFDRLSSQVLLSGCEQGLTQNANESLNGLLWSKCQKRIFLWSRTFYSCCMQCSNKIQ